MSATLAAPGRIAIAEPGACAHCGLPSPAGHRFCCAGCGAAFAVIQDLGLGRYYRDRLLDPERRALRPDGAPRELLQPHVSACADGSWEFVAAVDGLQCGACVWLIESVLAREPGVSEGRINLTTRRLRLAWRGAPEDIERLAVRVEALGYRLVPFTPAALAAARDETSRSLLRALAVAGFAAGNVMFLALANWVGERQGMGAATRDLLHWVAALIAMPAIVYASRPFIRSAAAVLASGRTNMDVPISIGVALVTSLSLWQTIVGGQQTYFESATMLLFFLLLGRSMDHRARGQARAAAEQLLALRHQDVTIVGPLGIPTRRRQHEIAVGDWILVGMGERIGADGVVERGVATLDTSLVTGESLPRPVAPGSTVYAGTLNLGAPLTIRVDAAGPGTMLAECVRLIEAAEARRGRYVVLADRVARAYAPAVHLCALLTFLYWLLIGGAPLATALIAAAAVLIITCPCALALAVPLVQVIATGRLFARGTLLKSPTALERVAEVTTICFDKTGTLTDPELRLQPTADPDTLRLAASLAAGSRHPLARALCAAAPPVAPAADLVERSGEGMSCPSPDGEIRLGSAAFCGADAGSGAELWLARPGAAPVRFSFAEHLRDDAAETLARLRRSGYRVRLLSGDRPESVAAIADALGIAEWRAACHPADKVTALEAWSRDGERVLMVGDELNDGPALAAASVSASPSSASDLSQTVADIVYQGSLLAPVADLLHVGRRARSVMRQNLALAFGYNALAVPVAMAGLLQPWHAAIAMSASSLLVMGNAARMRR